MQSALNIDIIKSANTTSSCSLTNNRLIIVINLMLLFTEDRVLKEIQEPAKKGIIVC